MLLSESTISSFIDVSRSVSIVAERVITCYFLSLQSLLLDESTISSFIDVSRSVSIVAERVITCYSLSLQSRRL